MKDICVLKDPKIAKELAEDSAQVAAKKMDLDAFKAKHAANLNYLIDPDHPDLGPKNNQFVFNSGPGQSRTGRSVEALCRRRPGFGE